MTSWWRISDRSLARHRTGLIKGSLTLEPLEPRLLLDGYSGGTGTQADPYQISSVADWQALTTTANAADWDDYFVLTTDLNFDGAALTPIAPDRNPYMAWFQGTPFTGGFDGAGHVIRNAVINQPDSDYVGLFGLLGEGGWIKNLSTENINITGNNNVGGLVGENLGDIISSSVTGAVNGKRQWPEDFVGGLVGRNDGTITYCHASGPVSGYDATGGLVGGNGGSLISCYASGKVIGRIQVGGLVGNNYGKVLVAGQVNNNPSKITSCFATGMVIGDTKVGGLVGENTFCEFTLSYATGAVSGKQMVGGLVGADSYSVITSCYATGAVSPTISNSSNIGGLVGIIIDSATVASCYATGTVSGYQYIGGLVGTSSGGIITSCFWDINTSGTSDGVGNLSQDPAGAMGRTTPQMKTISTFATAGWDFSSTDGNPADWQMWANDYPHLVCEVFVPEIEVQGNGVVIVDGNSIPSVSNGTDFGSVVQGGVTVSRIFTVYNTGMTVLTTSVPTVPTGFAITEPLSNSIVSGGSDSFTVQLSTSTAGTFGGDISFVTNNSPENLFNFRITGIVTSVSPALTISDTTIVESNAGTTNAIFIVTLDNPPSGTVNVNWTTTPGTATAEIDYVSGSGTLTFPPGTTYREITMVVNGDTAIENDETFYINLSEPTGGAKISKDQGIGIIKNDDLSDGQIDIAVVFDDKNASQKLQTVVAGSGQCVSFPFLIIKDGDSLPNDTTVNAAVYAMAKDNSIPAYRISAMQVSLENKEGRVSNQIQVQVPIPEGIPAGEYTVGLRMDSSDKMDEVDETNNLVFGGVFKVLDKSQDLAANFRVCKLPASLIWGQAVKGKIAVSVTNVGLLTIQNGQNANVELRLLRDSDGQTVFTSQQNVSVNRLKPGKAKTVSFSFNIPEGLFGQKYHFIAVVNPASSQDPNPSNNIAWQNTAGTELVLSPKPADSTGNTIAMSKKIKLGIKPFLGMEFVGDVDPIDMYRFTLSKPSLVTITTISILSDTRLTLLDRQDSVVVTGLGDGRMDVISQVVPPGTYYICVEAVATGNPDTVYSIGAMCSLPPIPIDNSTSASLRAVATSSQSVGESLDAALNDPKNKELRKTVNEFLTNRATEALGLPFLKNINGELAPPDDINKWLDYFRGMASHFVGEAVDKIKEGIGWVVPALSQAYDLVESQVESYHIWRLLGENIVDLQIKGFGVKTLRGLIDDQAEDQSATTKIRNSGNDPGYHSSDPGLWDGFKAMLSQAGSWFTDEKEERWADLKSEFSSSFDSSWADFTEPTPKTVDEVWPKDEGIWDPIACYGSVNVKWSQIQDEADELIKEVTILWQQTGSDNWEQKARTVLERIYWFADRWGLNIPHLTIPDNPTFAEAANPVQQSLLDLESLCEDPPDPSTAPYPAQSWGTAPTFGNKNIKGWFDPGDKDGFVNLSIDGKYDRMSLKDAVSLGYLPPGTKTGDLRVWSEAEQKFLD